MCGIANWSASRQLGFEIHVLVYERGLDIQLTHRFVSLQELVPITETMTIAFDYHRFIIGAKGANVRQMMEEFDVNITIPPSRDESDQVVIVGTRPKVNKAIEALEQKVAEIEAENEDRVSVGSSLRVLLYERTFPLKELSNGILSYCGYVQNYL